MILANTAQLFSILSASTSFVTLLQHVFVSGF